LATADLMKLLMGGAVPLDTSCDLDRTKRKEAST